MEVVKKVNLKKKKFIFKDFPANLYSLQDATVGEFGLSEGFGVYQTQLKFNGNTPNAIYSVGNKFYAFNGAIVELTESGERQVASLGEKLPAVKEIIYNGERCALFLGADGGVVINGKGEKTNVSLPTTEYCAVLGGRLFGGYNDSVYFTKPFEFELNSTALLVDGTISFSPASGKIVGLSVKNRKLYIFCKRAIYRLDVFGESIDFKLEKLEVGNIDVLEGSVQDGFDKILFVSCGKLYAFSQNKIEQILALPKWENILQTGASASSQSVYILPITTTDGKNKYFIYDLEAGGVCIADLGGGAVCKGGYFCAHDKTIKRIDRLGEKVKLGVYQTKPMDMGVFNDKTILCICLFVSADCKLKISGDEGSVSFSLKKGCNKKRLNFTSKSITIEISQIGQGFSIKDLYLQYTVRGE